VIALERLRNTAHVHFKKGEIDLLGETRNGALAEYCLCRASQLPNGVSDSTARAEGLRPIAEWACGGASPVFGSIGRGERHLEGVSPSLSALAPSFSRRANVALMPAHVARFAPDATA
jgi:hypothetical protein